MADLITGLFQNPLKGLGLPVFIENLGGIGLISFIIIGAIILSVIIFVFKERKKTAETEYEDLDYESIPISEPLKELARYKKTALEEKTETGRSTIVRPSMEIVNKAFSESVRIPLNEPMQIQVMIFGLKAAKEFLFFLPVPSGTQKMGIKQLLYGNGKTWVRDLDFKDFIIRRDRKTGNLLYSDADGKWRVWNPLEEIHRKGKAEREWVTQFRLIRGK
ncbi:MAG: hypothetical protein LBS84_00245 [Clostridiales bacterium]|jgi:hypothetical protein|nr:hypothetical protein [Clostridiales bacterium]